MSAPVETAKGGRKADAGKPRYDLLPVDAVRVILANREGLESYPESFDEIDGEALVENFDFVRNEAFAFWHDETERGSTAALENILVALLAEVAGSQRDDGTITQAMLWSGLDAVAKVLTFGAAKYAARNWEQGIAYSRVYGAMMRHLVADFQGASIDDETGLPHLAHAACCAMFLLTYELRGMTEFDDRPPVVE